MSCEATVPHALSDSTRGLYQRAKEVMVPRMEAKFAGSPARRSVDFEAVYDAAFFVVTTQIGTEAIEEDLLRARLWTRFESRTRDALRREGARKRGGWLSFLSFSEDVGAPPVAGSPGPYSDALVKEAVDRIRALLSEKKREADRFIIERVYLDGVSHEEVASLLGIQPDSVRKRIRRAFVFIAEEMSSPLVRK